jgi:sugar/nucleoside kinase (ribokinase family)
MRVVALGVHVLDVLARPVEEIPEGQGGALLEEIAVAPAGSAGGTAVTLARLGAEVRSAGAIGTDVLGDLLLSLLQGHGVDTSLLVRREGVQTSASVLPIRPGGERPALHVIGANAEYGPGDLPAEALDGVTHLHMGGPEFMGGEAAARILRPARERGMVTSADILAPGDPGLLEWIGPALEHLDYLLPNDEQAIGLAGVEDLEGACAALLERGPGCVAATCGGDGALIARPGGSQRVPAFPVEVVDTSGCGDAFSAGFLRGLALGLGDAEAGRLGCAAAGIVATGLGSDAGDLDLETALAMARG